MADIELVIKIDEEIYETLRKNYVILGWYRSGKTVISNIHNAVANGTPLPKGHGDLIDTKEITAFRELECRGHDVESLDEFTVIIEADTESEE